MNAHLNSIANYIGNLSSCSASSAPQPVHLNLVGAARPRLAFTCRSVPPESSHQVQPFEVFSVAMTQQRLSSVLWAPRCFSVESSALMVSTSIGNKAVCHPLARSWFLVLGFPKFMSSQSTRWFLHTYLRAWAECGRFYLFWEDKLLSEICLHLLLSWCKIEGSFFDTSSCLWSPVSFLIGTEWSAQCILALTLWNSVHLTITVILPLLGKPVKMWLRCTGLLHSASSFLRFQCFLIVRWSKSLLLKRLHKIMP